MKTIEIISHCYAAELPHYADALCYQLSSLFLYPPKTCRAVPAICWAGSEIDQSTQQVINYFAPRLNLVSVCLSKADLGRRCIGRDWVAKTSTADLIWFADVDQVYGRELLDRLASLEWPLVNGQPVAMVYPRDIKIHRDWTLGDQVTGRVQGEPQVIDIDPADFIDKRYNRAIGGVQIVRGDFAREHGYLGEDPEWRVPTPAPFSDFKDDVAYRRFCERNGGVVSADLPGLYRLRHTRTTYQPDKK